MKRILTIIIAIILLNFLVTTSIGYFRHPFLSFSEVLGDTKNNFVWVF